ncbi:MAG: SdpI family protein [Bacteroidota bacterium]
MVWQQLIAGPQLVGAIFIFAGVIQQKFPPTDIDGMYGYRTATSKQNQQTFDEGNRFSARWMLGCGILVFIFGVVLTIALHSYVTSAKTRSQILAASLLLSAIIPAILVIAITERHLKRTFNNQE